MALNRAPCLLNCRGVFKLNFSTSYCLDNSWRKRQGLEACPRKFSPLTNLPDYSFVDGRPAPLSLNKKRKLDIQKKYCEKIVELSTEIDIGLEKYHERQEEKKQKIEKLLGEKLKPKGAALLKNAWKKSK